MKAVLLHGARKRPAAARGWPRLYARLVRTGETFELARGVNLTGQHSASRLSMEFGPGWHVWHENQSTRSTPAPVSKSRYLAPAKKLTIKPVDISAADKDLLSFRQSTLQEIARAYSIPPRLLLANRSEVPHA